MYISILVLKKFLSNIWAYRFRSKNYRDVDLQEELNLSSLLFLSFIRPL